MKCKPYPAYKDSGVEWLGNVPEHWEVKAIKWLSPVLRGASPRPIDDPKYFDDQGEYAWVRIADASASDGRLAETTQRLSKLGSSLSVKLQPDQLFVSIAGTVGKPCITGIKCCIHDGFVYFPRLDIDPKFLFRLFESGACYAGLGKMGTQLNLNTDTIGSIRIGVPPSVEIDDILSFIDRETAKLDTLIDKQERLIELLQEKRQALISHVVTKGLDPDAPMKDSGVEWLGEVPEHWEIWQSRRLFSERKERIRSEDEQLTASQKYGVIPQKLFTELEDQKVMQVLTNSEILKHVEPGDFVISMRSFQGGIEWCGYRGCVSSAYVPLIPCNEIAHRYFKYLFKSATYIQALQRTSNLVRDGQALRFANFVHVPLPRLPRSEQEAIAGFLDAEISKLDALEQKSLRSIELMREHRTALISAAVTGKIDVREAA